MDDIKSKKDKLNETAMAFATKVYEEAAKQNKTEETSSDEESGSNKKDDNIKDDEYEEK